MLKSNPNFFHSLHEQVALGFDEKAQRANEKSNGVDKMRF